jgi:hypothetical protein
MDVGQGAEELVNVKLDLQCRHCRLQLVEITGCPVDGLWYELEHQVEIDLIFLRESVSKTMFARIQARGTAIETEVTYPLPIRIVKCLQFDNVWVPNNPHDLQLTVLYFPSQVSKLIFPNRPFHTVGYLRSEKEGSKKGATNLESLVLQDSLDGSVLTIGSQLRLEHYTERAVAHNLALRVLHFPVFASNSILHFFPNDICVENALVSKCVVVERKGW